LPSNTKDESHAKALVEAALFAAGRPISLRELSQVVGLPEGKIVTHLSMLAEEYLKRDSAIEIKRIGESHVMQVRADLAGDVSRMAPGELEAPVMRTLAIIAYDQPIKQSDVVAIRGNKSYGHIKELERMGLIRSEKTGRTLLLTTTKAFAEYFGLESDDPDSIRRILKMRQLIGVTPMYESLARRMGLKFVVINPYTPGDEDLLELNRLDLLIIAPGYTENVREYYSRKLIEASVRTFTQLKESVERICQVVDDLNRDDVEALLTEIDALLLEYRTRAQSAKAVKPLTQMIEDMALDVGILVDEKGVITAPDYTKMEAELTIPTHQDYSMDIVERLKERYEALLIGVER
jgi:segregation and condensation protein B